MRPIESAERRLTAAERHQARQNLERTACRIAARTFGGHWRPKTKATQT